MKNENRLKRLRLENQLTTRQIAFELRISPLMYQRWEQSGRIPKNAIPRIAQILGVPLVSLKALSSDQAADFTGKSILSWMLFHIVRFDTIAKLMVIL